MKKQKGICILTISGAKRYKLLNKIISSDIECEQIYDKDEQLSLSCSKKAVKQIKALAKGCGLDIKETINNSRLAAVKKHLLSHLGLMCGILLSAMLSLILSNMILRIKIENDDPNIKADILSVLDENGLHIGSFTNDFDYVKLERTLKSKVDGISWAGISVQGSTLVIDTIDNIPIPKSDNKRLPCNVVSLYDGVLEKAEVFSGELKVKVGSGIRAGDIIISGEQIKLTEQEKDKEPNEIKTYTRASGRIYGTFEKKAEFYFPYEQIVNTPTGKTEKHSYLNIFDTDIPLFFDDLEGKYTYKTHKKPLTIFGFELPLAVTDVEYNEYIEAVNYYTDEQISEMIEKSKTNYEQSFLSSFEIKDAKKKINNTNDGVSVSVTYTLYGEIGEQVDIYLNKG